GDRDGTVGADLSRAASLRTLRVLRRNGYARSCEKFQRQTPGREPSPPAGHCIECARSQMDSIGRRRWAIAEGYIPSESAFADRALISHETACILNAGDRTAQVAI